jgi:uncharacterized protein (TIGR00159 family)
VISCTCFFVITVNEAIIGKFSPEADYSVLPATSEPIFLVYSITRTDYTQISVFSATFVNTCVYHFYAFNTVHFENSVFRYVKRILETYGRRVFNIGVGIVFKKNIKNSTWNTAIEAICDSCVELSASCTGALIVIERKTRLGEQIETGTLMNAVPSKEVFGNIFYPKTPLHDGAVIIEDNHIVAAKCILPVTQSDVPKDYGTRHRSAIGMSELTDAVIIVVSEETGSISIAKNGQLKHNIDPQKFAGALKKALGQ